jgi:spoIIIJ-associated protein
MEKPTEETKQQVLTIAQDFLGQLQVDGSVTVDVDETDAYRVHINTEETGILIGHHGKTLESFQMILSLIVTKAIGPAKVYVNVNDYRERREESLMYLAQRAAERALETGRAVELTHLSPSERRVVHLTLSGDDRVDTESEGEGDKRILVVKPKASIN